MADKEQSMQSNRLQKHRKDNYEATRKHGFQHTTVSLLIVVGVRGAAQRRPPSLVMRMRAISSIFCCRTAWPV